MPLFARIRSSLRALFRGTRSDSEMDAELRFHIESRAADLTREGLAPDEALRRAHLEFGALERAKEECRESRGVAWLYSLAQDVRFGLRMLRKSPGFTIVAVLTLALGIGANTAIFSLLDSVLLRPLPVRDPSHLFIFGALAKHQPRYNGYETFGDCGNTGAAQCPFSVPFFRAAQSHERSFAGLAAFAGPIGTDLSGNGPASIANAEIVSGDFFSTLGATTILGRPLLPSDDSASATPAIVLSYAYWSKAFAGQRSVIGRTVFLNRVAFTIVGVADPHFPGLTPGVPDDFWLPLGASGGPSFRNAISDTHTAWIVIAARLKPGISTSQAQTETTLIYRDHLLSQKLSDAADNPRIVLMPAPQTLDGGRSAFAKPLFALMSAVGLVLLIACVNLAGLMLARSATRQKEMAVRLALGASRLRVVRQLLTESVMLSIAGGIAGIWVAYWGIHALVSLMSVGLFGAFPLDVTPDARILAFTAGIALLTGVIFGLGPAIRATRVDLAPALKENSSLRSASAKRIHRWFSAGNGLVATQVALAIVVLAGAGLLVRTLENLRNVQPGFDTRNILMFGINPQLAGYESASLPALYGNLRQEFAALPGVRFVSYSSMPPLSHYTSETDVNLGTSRSDPRVHTQDMEVGPAFFSGMRVPLLLGRDFTPADFAQRILVAQQRDAERAASASSPVPAAKTGPPPQTPLPVLVNSAFVRKYLEPGNVAPLGKLLGVSPTYRIVGVVADMHFSNLRGPIDPAMYSPLTDGDVTFELRTASDPAALIPAVRSAVARTNSNLAVWQIEPLSQQIDHLLLMERLMAQVSGFFAILALILACVGLYGLLSYETARRTHEIGIRMALGAEPRDVLRLVIRQGIAIALIGAILGTAVSLGVTRYLQSLLFGVRPNDPATLIGVAILLLAVALLACYIPARRAMRVDPLTALRHE